MGLWVDHEGVTHIGTKGEVLQPLATDQTILGKTSPKSSSTQGTEQPDVPIKTPSFGSHSGGDSTPISDDEVNSPVITQLRRSSTDEFDHVPFDEFSLQVKELCNQLWPSISKASSTDQLMGGYQDRFRLILRGKRFNRALKSSSNTKDFIIERMRGGNFNRVVGLTVLYSNGDLPLHLVLRVPRHGDTAQDAEIAILQFVGKHTSIPVPEIRFLDPTTNNPLKERYVIQNRIPGHDLQNDRKSFWYPGLSHTQKCTVARELARILLELQEIRHPFPGYVENNGSDSSYQVFKVRPFRLSTPEYGPEPEPDLRRNGPFFEIRPYDAAFKPAPERSLEETTRYFMQVQFGRWKALELRRDPACIGWYDYYDRLATVAYEMDQLFQLGDNENCLCHLDLNTAPRNIMVDIRPDDSLEVTAIIDWDSAAFAPRFAGCAPPMWLWAWAEDEDEEERFANDEPDKPENREIKRIFEEAVGSSFNKYAYLPEYRLARMLFRFAIYGITSNSDIQEAQDLFDEWAYIRGEKMAEMEEAEKEHEAIAEDTNVDPNLEENSSSTEGKKKEGELFSRQTST